MLKRDLVPDIECYIAVIDGFFIQKGRMKSAWEALHRMLNSGLRPSTSTFHLVLLGLLKKDGCAKEAADLIEIMLERKIRLLKNLLDAAQEFLQTLPTSAPCGLEDIYSLHINLFDVA
ncbi:pentatricopeptide repeat-containing protein [Panicum miliaceum]|uniref:Pentatricopeptide repeat-containing protein n=1 Tax=Panicum miliaceum TaxID=4540 RepID=A0A3L6T7L0_PANMI|nr:pentatricopeptide repeat-containing protein [Panicum miliaceum]